MLLLATASQSEVLGKQGVSSGINVWGLLYGSKSIC